MSEYPGAVLRAGLIDVLVPSSCTVSSLVSSSSVQVVLSVVEGLQSCPPVALRLLLPDLLYA